MKISTLRTLLIAIFAVAGCSMLAAAQTTVSMELSDYSGSCRDGGQFTDPSGKIQVSLSKGTNTLNEPWFSRYSSSTNGLYLYSGNTIELSLTDDEFYIESVEFVCDLNYTFSMVSNPSCTLSSGSLTDKGHNDYYYEVFEWNTEKGKQPLSFMITIGGSSRSDHVVLTENIKVTYSQSTAQPEPNLKPIDKLTFYKGSFAKFPTVQTSSGEAIDIKPEATKIAVKGNSSSTTQNVAVQDGYLKGMQSGNYIVTFATKRTEDYRSTTDSFEVEVVDPASYKDNIIVCADHKSTMNTTSTTKEGSVELTLQKGTTTNVPKALGNGNLEMYSDNLVSIKLTDDDCFIYQVVFNSVSSGTRVTSLRSTTSGVEGTYFSSQASPDFFCRWTAASGVRTQNVTLEISANNAAEVVSIEVRYKRRIEVPEAVLAPVSAVKAPLKCFTDLPEVKDALFNSKLPIDLSSIRIIGKSWDDSVIEFKDGTIIPKDVKSVGSCTVGFSTLPTELMGSTSGEFELTVEKMKVTVGSFASYPIIDREWNKSGRYTFDDMITLPDNLAVEIKAPVSVTIAPKGFSVVEEADRTLENSKESEAVWRQWQAIVDSPGVVDGFLDIPPSALPMAGSENGFSVGFDIACSGQYDVTFKNNSSAEYQFINGETNRTATSITRTLEIYPSLTQSYSYVLNGKKYTDDGLTINGVQLSNGMTMSYPAQNGLYMENSLDNSRLYIPGVYMADVYYWYEGLDEVSPAAVSPVSSYRKMEDNFIDISGLKNLPQDGEMTLYLYLKKNGAATPIMSSSGHSEHFLTMSLDTKNAVPTGIDRVQEEVNPVFYNLQGVRVANPAPGQLYVKVAGGKAEKVIVK